MGWYQKMLPTGDDAGNVSKITHIGIMKRPLDLEPEEDGLSPRSDVITH